MIRHKEGFVLISILCLLQSVRCELKPHRRLDNTSSYITCTRHFSEDNFTINLPKSTETSPFECKFFVNPSSSDVCRLKLNFKQFTLRSSTSCRDQFLRVGGQRLCGSILGPQTIPFSESPMIIHYRGDGEHSLLIEVEQEHCKIQATLRNNCDVTSSELQTVISSPNFPNHYPTPLTCIYNINPNSPNICQLDIKFNYFQLPESENCAKSRLIIDGKPYCGQKTGRYLVSKVNQPSKFEFSSAVAQESGSFQITVNQIQCDKSGNVSAHQIELSNQFPPLCCNRVFDSRNFIIISPGFLDLAVPNLNCAYQIVRSSPSICRLRISFLHFWLGQEDVFYGCTDGFLEIDGRRICGCKDGLIIDSYFVGDRKDFWLNMRGLRGKGFVIEINQEDCGNFRARSVPEEVTENPNTEVEVFSTNTTVEKIQSRFFVPSDDSRCYQWGLPHWLDKIHALIRLKSGQCPITPSNSYPPIFPPQNPIHPPQSPIHPPSCLAHNPILPPYPQNPIVLPPFPPYPQNPIVPPPFPPNPQNPIIPSPFPPIPQNPIIPPPFPSNPQNPIIPPPFPPNPQNPILPPHFPPNPQNPIIPPPFPPYPQNPIIPPRLPPRPQNPIIPPPVISFPPPPCRLCPQPPSRQCQIFSSQQGGFQSPGYPWKYPSNLNCCYRFRQLPGYCSLQVSFLDFDICWSPKCWKDFVILDQRARYCSRSLQSSAAFLPFRNGFASIDFETDDFLASRGFRAVFRQIPCLNNPFLPRSDSEAPREIDFVTKTPISTTTEFTLNVTPAR